LPLACCCRECGEVLDCPNCQVGPCIYHKAVNRLKCHYCLHQEVSAPEVPRCALSRYLRSFGVGTEQLRRPLVKSFPESKNTLRLDADTTRRRGRPQRHFAPIRPRTGARSARSEPQMVRQGPGLSPGYPGWGFGRGFGERLRFRRYPLLGEALPSSCLTQGGWAERAGASLPGFGDPSTGPTQPGHFRHRGAGPQPSD